MEKFLELEPTNRANILASLANEGKITVSQLKKVGMGLPSFSSAKWSELPASSNLPKNPFSSRSDSSEASDVMAGFDPVITPVLLPPSFHETIAMAAWQIQDVYQERDSQKREEARVRVFEAYIIPIIKLFQGRIIDMPEQSMISTAYSSGGKAEHELLFTASAGVMIENILFLIIELKLRDIKENWNYVAQLLLSLLSAAEMNKNAKFEGLQVYGLLTNLRSFHFFSYDQSRGTFALDHKELKAGGDRESFMVDMIHVTNKIFTIVLEVYVNGLNASVVNLKASHEKPVDNKSTVTGRSGKSTKQWELALEYATQSLNKFREPVQTVEDIEKNSSEAVKLLTKSVRCIPRVSKYSGKEDPSTEKELKSLTRRIVHAEHMTMVGAQRSST